MKRVSNTFRYLFVPLMMTIAAFSMEASAGLKTVDYVDVGRYLGDWYQIAHIPFWFEGGDCPCARQRLTLKDKGVVGVFNSCNTDTPDGKLRTIKGEAYNDDVHSNSRFTVDFHQGFTGTYWIIGLDSEYRFAVVSDKGGDALYVLSKTPTLAPDLYAAAIKMAEEQNLEIKKVVKTVQKGCKYPKFE